MVGPGPGFRHVSKPGPGAGARTTGPHHMHMLAQSRLSSTADWRCQRCTQLDDKDDDAAAFKSCSRQLVGGGSGRKSAGLMPAYLCVISMHTRRGRQRQAPHLVLGKAKALATAKGSGRSKCQSKAFRMPGTSVQRTTLAPHLEGPGIGLRHRDCCCWLGFKALPLAQANNHQSKSRAKVLLTLIYSKGIQALFNCTHTLAQRPSLGQNLVHPLPRSCDHLASQQG